MARHGILVDYQYCTGCYSCEVACQAEHEFPLEQWGVKVLQNGPWPIKTPDGEDTDRYVYDFVPAFTRICDLCADRQAHGKLPSCVFHCQAKCMKYGTVEELAADLAAKPEQYLWVPACAEA